MNKEKILEILNNTLQLIDKIKTEGVQNAAIVVSAYNSVRAAIGEIEKQEEAKE